MADSVEARGAKRPQVTVRWRQEARLLLDRDGRTLDEVLELIAWSAEDQFWRANVLSVPKLREQYDRLRLQRQRASPGRSLAEPRPAFEVRNAAIDDRVRSLMSGHLAGASPPDELKALPGGLQ